MVKEKFPEFLGVLIRLLVPMMTLPSGKDGTVALGTVSVILVDTSPTFVLPLYVVQYSFSVPLVALLQEPARSGIAHV